MGFLLQSTELELVLDESEVVGEWPSENADGSSTSMFVGYPDILLNTELVANSASTNDGSTFRLHGGLAIHDPDDSNRPTLVERDMAGFRR